MSVVVWPPASKRLEYAVEDVLKDWAKGREASQVHKKALREAYREKKAQCPAPGLFAEGRH